MRNYTVQSSELRSDGIYTVTIKADVGELQPGAGDKLTFQMMAKEHQAPRVTIQITEKIDGLSDSSVATDWLRNTATECGLKVVDMMRSQGAMAKRAEALGRTQEAALRGNDAVSACDYIIEGEITGAMTGEQSFYGSKPGKRFSLGANLRVIDAATGMVLLTETPPSRDILIRQVTSDTAAARDAVRQLLEGSPRIANSDEGWKLIRRIFSSWATKTDLGATIKMEFAGMDVTTATQLQEKLATQKGIGSIWIRSIDAAGVSVIDCESRVDSTTLAQMVSQLQPQYALDRSEKRYLSFLRSSKAPAAKEAAADSSSSLLIYVLIGLGALAFVALILFFIKRK